MRDRVIVLNNPINRKDPKGTNPAIDEALGFILDNLAEIAEYATTWARGQVDTPGGPDPYAEAGKAICKLPKRKQPPIALPPLFNNYNAPKPQPPGFPIGWEPEG